MSELKVILLLNEWDTGGQQGIGRQDSVQGWLERSSVVAAGWAEAAHLICLDRTSNWRMLSVWRRRAASEDVGFCSSVRARCRHTFGLTQ